MPTGYLGAEIALKGGKASEEEEMPKESSRILRRAPDCGGEREIKQRLRLSGEEERNRTGWKKRKEAV